MASECFLGEAVKVARSRDQSGSRHADDGTRTEHELGAAAERLREERDEVRARLAIMSRDLENLFAASADSNADDEHDPEGQTIAYERSQLAALIMGAQDHLAGIEAGLIRMKEGKYGICEVCGQPIPAARMEARPTARTCIQHTTPTRA
jgi:RNA polymerase-binding transcription factor DksA